MKRNRIISAGLLLALLSTIPFSIFSQNLSDGLISHFPLNGDATEISGNGTDGILNGTIPVPDRFGNPDQALEFDGVDDYISTATMDINRNFSISAWVKPGEGDVVIYSETNKDIPDWENWRLWESSRVCLYWDSNDRKIKFQVSTTVMQYYAGDDIVYETNLSLNPENWNHVVAIRNYRNIEIYINGLSSGLKIDYETGLPTLDYDLKPAVDAQAGHIQALLGKECSECTPQLSYTAGAVDDLRIYNRSLKAADVQEMFGVNNWDDQFTGLIAHYPLDGSTKDVGPYILSANGTGSPTTDRLANPDMAIDFSGGMGMLIYSDHLNHLEKGTMSFWVKIPDIARSSKFAVFYSEPPYGYRKDWGGIRVLQNGSLLFDYNNPDTDDKYSYTSPIKAVKEGEWNHIVFTLDGSTGMKAFVNRFEVPLDLTTQGIYTGTEFFADLPLQMDGIEIAIEGLMDELKFFDYPLSKEEVIEEFHIGEYGSNVAFSLSGTNTTLIGEDDGAIDLTIVEGTPPYSFNWSNGDSSEDIAGLTAGEYHVSVSDANGESYSHSIHVYDSFTDERDGKVYKAVQLGDQVWMAENLAYMPMVSSREASSYYTPHYYIYEYGDWDTELDTDYVKSTGTYKTYGVLYNYPAAEGACPDNWHLPANEEWQQLTGFLGEKAGNKMKDPGHYFWRYENEEATNEAFFNGVPGGFYLGVSFMDMGTTAHFWTTDKPGVPPQRLSRRLEANSEGLGGSTMDQLYGLSVRCVQEVRIIDSDNDGLTDLAEDLDGDGDPENDDTDGDGIPNYLDPDDNNNGIPSADEDDGDGDWNNDDVDEDGIPDYLDDHVAPEIACPEPVTVSADAGLCEVNVVLEVPVSTDNFGSTSLTNNYTGSADASATYPVGTTTITWTATDASGNSTASQVDVIVVDDQIPAISATATVISGNDPGTCYAALVLPDPVVSDNCGIASVINDAPSVYPVGSSLITWTVTDIHGNQNTATTTVNVSNAVPVISEIIVPLEPIQLGNALAVSATYVDDNLESASWNWGDGTDSPGIIGASITGEHIYTETGVYTITLTLTDKCGVEVSSEYQFIEPSFKSTAYSEEETVLSVYQYVAVFDPEGGFVSGAGWIDSPPGAMPTNPDAVGKANFAFVSKYVKNKIIPDGNTRFKFRAGDLNFVSTDYDWLVIAGTTAKFKGSGTVDDIIGYGFMISAIDADLKDKGDTDRFRIKIWDKLNGEVVYDNETGDIEAADPSTEIDAGSIVIHKSPDFKGAYTAMDESELSGNKVYPNPFEQSIRLELMVAGDNRILIDILSMEGRVVDQLFVGDLEKQVLQHFEFSPEPMLSPGSYILRVRNDHGEVLFREIITRQ